MELLNARVWIVYKGKDPSYFRVTVRPIRCYAPVKKTWFMHILILSTCVQLSFSNFIP